MVEEAKDDHDDTTIPKTEVGIPVQPESSTSTVEPQVSIMPDNDVSITNNQDQSLMPALNEVGNNVQVNEPTIPIQNDSFTQAVINDNTNNLFDSSNNENNIENTIQKEETQQEPQPEEFKPAVINTISIDDVLNGS